MIAITFDVDDVAWTLARPCDELVVCAPRILEVLEEMPEVRTTWFIRMDAGMALRHGRDDALFVRHRDLVQALRERGHEVAWHHHSMQPGSDSLPSTDVDHICSELERLALRARKYGLTSVRLGWAFSDARIASCLDAIGMTVDSSALPRPAYPWDAVARDWTGTRMAPYHPSISDHRVAGQPSLRMLEVPMTVATLPVPTDTRADVMRYVNLAYHQELFREAIDQVREQPVIVTVTHPYEVMPASAQHAMLAFSVDALRGNLAVLQELQREFVTVSSIGQQFANETIANDRGESSPPRVTFIAKAS